MPKRRRVTLGDLIELANAGNKSERRRVDDLALNVVIDDEAPRDSVLPVRDALVPLSANARVCVKSVHQGSFPDADATILIAGAMRQGFLEAMSVLMASGRPFCVAVQSIAMAEECLGVPADDLDYLVVSRGVGDMRLARWLVRSCPHKRIALAANFDFCRKAVAEVLSFECAKANAVVATIDLVSGADLPVMLMSQASLAFDIAACYGKRVGFGRTGELAAVTAGAFAYRALARRLVRVLPQAPWMARGTVGFAGTLAMGLALSAYHGWRNDLRWPFLGRASQKSLVVRPTSL